MKPNKRELSLLSTHPGLLMRLWLTHWDTMLQQHNWTDTTIQPRELSCTFIDSQACEITISYKQPKPTHKLHIPTNSFSDAFGEITL